MFLLTCFRQVRLDSNDYVTIIDLTVFVVNKSKRLTQAKICASFITFVEHIALTEQIKLRSEFIFAAKFYFDIVRVIDIKI